jgi:hypothetical protein
MIDETKQSFIIGLLFLCFMILIINYSLIYEAFRTRVLQGLLILFISIPFYLLREFIDRRMWRVDEDEV